MTERKEGSSNEKRVKHLRQLFYENIAAWRVTSDERTELATPKYDYELIRQNLFKWNVDTVLSPNLACAPRWIRHMVAAAGTGGWVRDGELFNFQLMKKVLLRAHRCGRYV